MKKTLTPSNFTNLSYELYQELVSEICSPITDKEITLQLRFELYKSKLIYLYNISEQCFRSVNSKNENKELGYTLEDFKNIKNAIQITKEFLRQTIKESLLISISCAQKNSLYK